MTSSSPTEILAKSEPRLSLREHIDDCLLISKYLQKSFPNLPFTDIIDFYHLLRLCILFHDLGKAHQEFQKLLDGKANQWNHQRHELFSLPFVDAFEANSTEKEFIKLVVAGHHKDFDTLHREYIRRDYQEKDDDEFNFFPTLEEEDRSFATAFGRNVPVEVVRQLLSEYEISLYGVAVNPIQPLVRRYLKNRFTQSHPQYFPLLLLFGAMKHCDHLGSARVGHIPNLEPSDFAFLQKQQEALIAEELDFYPHQKESAKVVGNLILTAPTGSGKTESAFLWLREQMQQFGQGRVFYVLPFTASINAMYERLGKDIYVDPESPKVGMLHGKLSDYLNNYFEDLQYSASEKKEEIKSIREKFKTLLTPVKVVTPFQLLKHLFGLKGFEQGIFEWVGSYFIFDEIHAYSPEVFAQIKVLLEFVTKHLNAKVMVMTATMPSFLREELSCAIKDFTPVKATPAIYQAFTRHQVILKEGLLSENLSLIRKELKAGKKVLVVCNTVHEAQQVFGKLKHSVSEEEAVLLHSGFNGQDRNRKEKNLKKDQIRLLVGTQAIEVSLDIDYDLIFTEPAPIDALIQRFGRVNRKRKKGICSCYIFKERNKLDSYVYNSKIVERSLEAFAAVEREQGGVIDEQQLQKSIDFVYPKWDEESREEFDRIYRYLTEAVKDLSPLLHSKHTEEEFYKQFDGIKILPQECKEAFLSHLKNFDFISAESLKVQIRKKMFAGWMKNNFLRQEKFVFETEKGKLLTIPYYLTNKPYSSETGLMAKAEGEPWQEDNIW